ncbi:MAG: c-type cytochrome [Nitrospirales bacterium]
MFRSNTWLFTWPFIRIWLFAITFSSTWSLLLVEAETEHRGSYGIGHSATQAEIQDWNIDIASNGAGLPPGQGTVIEGATVYAKTCASCHGTTGIEGPRPKLVGGHNTLNTDHPLKTVGSYWPYATTLFDYIYRAMPLTAPQSLSPNETYAVVAWILFRNGIIKESSTLNANILPSITMPNRKGFVRDPRPEILKKNP